MYAILSDGEQQRERAKERGCCFRSNQPHSSASRLSVCLKTSQQHEQKTVSNVKSSSEPERSKSVVCYRFPLSRKEECCSCSRIIYTDVCAVLIHRSRRRVMSQRRLDSTRANSERRLSGTANSGDETARRLNDQRLDGDTKL